jgi:FixJ family two-component response regulator
MTECSAEQGDIRRPAVVIVEDDDEVRLSMQMLLGSRGYETSGFASPDLLMRDGLPDQTACLLLDYRMPGLNGIELLSKLRDAGNTVPAIMVTGFFNNQLEARARQAGFTAVCEKPIMIDRFFDVIASVVHRNLNA